MTWPLEAAAPFNLALIKPERCSIRITWTGTFNFFTQLSSGLFRKSARKKKKKSQTDGNCQLQSTASFSPLFLTKRVERRYFLASLSFFSFLSQFTLLLILHFVLSPSPCPLPPCISIARAGSSFSSFCHHGKQKWRVQNAYIKI